MLPTIEIADDLRTLRRVLSEYTLPAGISSIAPVSSGLINHTWKIDLSQGEAMILQRINTAVFENPRHLSENLEYLRDYLKLSAPGYLFVAPVPTSKHELIVEDDRGYFRLFPFVQGSHSIDVVHEPQQAYEAARQFGIFTNLLSGFDAKKLKRSLPNFHNLSVRYEQFRIACSQGNPIRIAQTKDLIEYLNSQSAIEESYQQIESNNAFRSRVTHHDTKISNVLFNDRNEGLCVIDLDTVMAGYYISDAGDMIRTYTPPVNEEESDLSKIQIRQDYFEAVVKGYFSQMKTELSEAEKQHFVYAGKFMIYMQAIRFLTDHLNNDIYYGAKYEGQNLVRAQNQAYLLQQLNQKEVLLNKIVDEFSR